MCKRFQLKARSCTLFLKPSADAPVKVASRKAYVAVMKPA
jgi:hypothetical protein